ncbi:MAG: DUF1559 domain-containing protein, partial [Planctomycetota bacterium]
ATSSNGAQRSGKSPVLWILLAVGGVGMVLFLCCGVALILPAVQAAREAARRMACSNNVKQIGLGLANYHASWNSFPPAYTVDANGNRLHSWRTLILPYVEQQPLYDRIDLTKPWDDPANAFLLDTEVAIYRCPSFAGTPAYTTYLGLVDAEAVFQGDKPSRYRDIIDGTSNTVMVVEAGESMAVHWAAPEDITISDFATGFAGDHSHVQGGHVLFADGSVVFMTDFTKPTDREAIATRAGGEAVNPGAF